MSLFDNIIKKIFHKAGNNVIGVDVGSTSIKIVQLSLVNGSAVLDTFGEISLSPYGDKEVGTVVNLGTEKIAEALKDLLEEAQTTSNNLLFAIPLKSSLMFNLKLPKKIENSKLDSVVKLEAKKYIPVPIDEVEINWTILPSLVKDTENKIEENNEILVIAIHRETIDKYVEIAKIIKKKISTIEIEIFSTIRSVVKHDRNNMIIIDVGDAITKIYITEYGIVRKSNIINIGSNKVLKKFRTQLQDKKGIKNSDINHEIIKLFREEVDNFEKIPADLLRIIDEVKVNIIAYQNETGHDITEAIFTGGACLFDKFYDDIKKKLYLDIIESDPFSKVKSPVYLDEPLMEAGPEFAVAVGIALRGLGELKN